MLDVRYLQIFCDDDDDDDDDNDNADDDDDDALTCMLVRSRRPVRRLPRSDTGTCCICVDSTRS